MHHLLLSLLFGLLFTACTIVSPTTTTTNWLKALQNQYYDTAVDYMVVTDNNQLRSLTQTEKNTFISEYEKQYGMITGFSVDNQIPLNEETLNPLGAQQGYEVYFTLGSEKAGKTQERRFVIMVTGEWKIVYQQI